MDFNQGNRHAASSCGTASPLSAGATGESTAEKTDSLASSMSCCVKWPDFAQSTPLRNADRVCTEFGSLTDGQEMK